MSCKIAYPEPIERAIAQIESLLSIETGLSLEQNYPIAPRSLALLLSLQSVNNREPVIIGGNIGFVRPGATCL